MSDDTSWAPVSLFPECSWHLLTYVPIKLKLIFVSVSISVRICFTNRFLISKRPWFVSNKKGPTCADEWLGIVRWFHNHIGQALPCDCSLKQGCLTFSACNPLLNQNADEMANRLIDSSWGHRLRRQNQRTTNVPNFSRVYQFLVVLGSGGLFWVYVIGLLFYWTLSTFFSSRLRTC